MYTARKKKNPPYTANVKFHLWTLKEWTLLWAFSVHWTSSAAPPSLAGGSCRRSGLSPETHPPHIHMGYSHRRLRDPVFVLVRLYRRWDDRIASNFFKIFHLINNFYPQSLSPQLRGDNWRKTVGRVKCWVPWATGDWGPRTQWSSRQDPASACAVPSLLHSLRYGSTAEDSSDVNTQTHFCETWVY